MIDTHRCTRCKISYELSYDDSPDVYYSSVEDTDCDHCDHEETVEPGYCPFCGNHIRFDDDEDDDF